MVFSAARGVVRWRVLLMVHSQVTLCIDSEAADGQTYRFGCSLVRCSLLGVCSGSWTSGWALEGTAIAWLGLVVTAVVVLLPLPSRWLLPQKSKFVSRLGMAAVGGLMVLYLASLLQEFAVRWSSSWLHCSPSGLQDGFGVRTNRAEYLIHDRMRATVESSKLKREG